MFEAKVIELWQGTQFSRFAALRVSGGGVYCMSIPDNWVGPLFRPSDLDQALNWIAAHFDELEDGQALEIEKVAQ